MPSDVKTSLTENVTEMVPGLPVLVVTGYAGGDIGISAAQLAKPFRQSELAAALERLVN